MAAMVAITKVVMLQTRTILRMMYPLPILGVCSIYRRVLLKAWTIRCQIIKKVLLPEADGNFLEI